LGQDGDLVTDEEILINTATIQHGWILWSGGRPNKIFVGFTQPLPQAMEPILTGKDAQGNDTYDSPSEARSLQGALVDDGEPLAFDTNSYGGRKSIDVLLGKIKAHSAEGSKFLYPRVKLTSESYANKKRGGKLTFNPVFEIVAWCNEDGDEEGEAPGMIAAQKAEDRAAEPDPAEDQPTEPKKRQRRKKKNAA
jgi:hypothetical protein